MRTAGTLVRTAALVTALVATAASAGAQSGSWIATLNGPNESPPVASPGVGVATFYRTGNSFSFSMSFANLLPTTAAGAPSGTTMAHIHCCTAVPFTSTVGVATELPSFLGFPLAVRAGSFATTYDMLAASTYNPAFLAANGGLAASARDAFFAGVNSGRAYLNVHTNAFPGGEIRGFLVVTPEPGSILLMAAGLVAVGGLSWRKRRRG